MRLETLLMLCKRVLIKNMPDLLWADQRLRTELGAPSNKELFRVELRRKFNEFYELRNGLVHAIEQNIGVGQTIVTSWTSFFDVFCSALADAFEAAEANAQRGWARRRPAQQVA
jgi:hypothetical protein